MQQGGTQGTQDELRRTRDQLAEAQRLARLGSWEWDIVANEVTWSDELFRIYGLQPGETEPSYEEFLARVHPDDRESVDERNRRAFADHQPFEDVKRCVKSDGSIFLMRTKGEVVTDGEQPVRMLGICEDVTAEKEAERALAELASIVQSSDDAIIGRSLKGKITSWNPGATRLFGYPAEEAIGRDAGILIPADSMDGDDVQERVRRLIQGETVEHFEARLRRKDGTLIDVSLGMSAIGGKDGELIGISIIGRDITERKRFEAQLKRLADDDPLTGLFNRRRFEEELKARVAHARRYRTGGAVLMLDLDNFKYVNDAFGHSAGDELVRGVARLLSSRLRETDVIARLGGDEFAVFLPEADEVGAEAVAATLLKAVRDHAGPTGDRPVSITTSIGIARLSPDTVSADELMADVDRAMYAAKDAGRDRFATVSASEREHGELVRLGWEHRIREALEQDLFILDCQPILDLRRGEISQYELLLRMDDGTAPIPPGAFLGVAERLGLIHAIDRWVAGEAIRLLVEHPDLQLEVNLSARSLDDPELLQLIRDGIARHHFDPTRLIFEVTETAAIGNLEVARKLAHSLHELGCRFALDDFGAGFGSFYYLKHLPAGYLKIDGDFVASPRSKTDDLVIGSIVQIAQGLGLKTIAEFVEDAATLEAVRDMGVDFAQGFHVGRPFPVSNLVGAAA